MARTTREALASALKLELRTKPLDRVTVSALTEQARVNRQTFYYHFADVYDLAEWVFEEEVAKHIMEHASYAEWANGYRELLQYFQDNFSLVKAVTDSLNHRQREAFFMGQFSSMMRAIVTELQGDLVLSEDDLQFIVNHYAATVLGHFLRWMSGGGREDPTVLVGKIERILRGSVRESLERFARSAD